MEACPWMGFKLYIVVRETSLPEKQKRWQGPKIYFTFTITLHPVVQQACRGLGAVEGASDNQYVEGSARTASQTYL